jgi:RNA polymerase sigma factor (sigma-70 family)
MNLNPESDLQGRKQQLLESIFSTLKSRIMWLLHRAGVNSQYLNDAYHDVVMAATTNINQLRCPNAFKSWLGRIIVSAAKQYWAPYKPSTRPGTPNPPVQVGTKSILIDGKHHAVRVFEPYAAQEQPTARQPLYQSLSDPGLMKWSRSNPFPDYHRRIDVWKAMAGLNHRRAQAMFLRFVFGYTGEETGRILGCTGERVHRLVEETKKLLQESLPGYAPNSAAKSEKKSWEGRQNARLKRTLSLSTLPPRRCWIVIQIRVKWNEKLTVPCRAAARGRSKE